MRSILTLVVVIILIVLALKFWDGRNANRNDISRSLDKAADNINEGINDAKRGIKDALD